MRVPGRVIRPMDRPLAKGGGLRNSSKRRRHPRIPLFAEEEISDDAPTHTHKARRQASLGFEPLVRGYDRCTLLDEQSVRGHRATRRDDQEQEGKQLCQLRFVFLVRAQGMNIRHGPAPLYTTDI